MLFNLKAHLNVICNIVVSFFVIRLIEAFFQNFRNAFFCGRFIFCNCNKKYPLTTKSTLNPSILESLLEKRILFSVSEVFFEPYFNRTFLCSLRVQPYVGNEVIKATKLFRNYLIILSIKGTQKVPIIIKDLDKRGD